MLTQMLLVKNVFSSNLMLNPMAELIEVVNRYSYHLTQSYFISEILKIGSLAFSRSKSVIVRGHVTVRTVSNASRKGTHEVSESSGKNIS